MKILLISHGPFSKGLSETVQMIVGEQDSLFCFGLYPEDSVETLEEKIEELILRHPDEEFVAFTDLYFGSPFNTINKLMGKYHLYHVTGINVPLLLEAITMSRCGKSAEEISREIVEKAGESVVDVRSQLLELLKEEEQL